jgi:hypothetical protein
VDDAASFIGFVHEEVGKTKLSREEDPALPVLYQNLTQFTRVRLPDRRDLERLSHLWR